MIIEPAPLPVPAGRALTLDDAALLTAARRQRAAELSDAAFVNLYLFRHVHRYRLHTGPLPHIRGFAYDGTELVIPLFNPEPVPPDTLLALLGRQAWLYPFAQPDAERLAPAFDVSWNESDSDYVYAAERLRHFKGLKARRQQLRQFEAGHGASTTLRTIGDDATLQAARHILSLWQQDVAGAGLETDFGACLEALGTLPQLGLFGLLAETGGAPAGFLLASQLSPRMAAIHFAKGLRRFPGIYPFMFQAFARTHPTRALINFEQDLGKPGFRQAKQSYRPLYLARKYRIRPKVKQALLF